jgi:ETC complex I subunit conserved region
VLDFASAQNPSRARSCGSVSALLPSTLPPDAVAVGYRPTRSATSAPASSRCWKLGFERRSAPYIEPLVSWTGREYTPVQVELTFPSAEAAIAHPRHQGLEFIVRGVRRKNVKTQRDCNAAAPTP